MEVRQAFTRRPPPRRNRLIREEKPATAMDVRWKNGMVHALLLVTGIGFGVLVFPLLEQQMNQPVAKVSVTGDLFFLDKREVMAQVPVYQGDHLLDVNLDAIQQQLERMPWIYSARVSRQWPDTIAIAIVEQKPIAFWNDGLLLNQYGNVFERNGKPMKDLPLLFGVPGTEINVMQRFQEFSQLLAPEGIKVVRLKQNEQLAWEVETDKGIRLQLGSTQALEKMQRFVFLYENQLKNASRSAAVVDLRYNNGAAVSWAPLVTDVDSSELNKG
jgi:cell division protein FtsQ